MKRHLCLFSGIGGFILAAQRAGFTTVQAVEIEAFCRAILAKNFPGLSIHDDIRTYNATHLRGTIGLLTGGFPCQDISVAGKGAGIEGERSGLWREMFRILCECRPAFVLIENVPALKSRGADRVLSDLEGADYTAGAFVVGADDIGATHRRKRVWIVAYAESRETLSPEPGGLHPEPAVSGGAVADPDELNRGRELSQSSLREQRTRIECEGNSRSLPAFPPARNDFRGWVTVASVDASLMPCVEREVRPVVDGLPLRLVQRHRNATLKALGNAIVPQVAEIFCRWIYEEVTP